MKKFSILKERIRQFAEKENTNITEIRNNCNISDGTLSNSSGLGEENILKFFSFYKDVDANWFIKGEGEMKIASNSGVNNDLLEALKENSKLLKDKIELIEKLSKMESENAALKARLEIAGKSDDRRSTG